MELDNQLFVTVVLIQNPSLADQDPAIRQTAPRAGNVVADMSTAGKGVIATLAPKRSLGGLSEP